MRRFSPGIGALVIAGALCLPVGAASSASAATCPVPPAPPTPTGVPVGEFMGALTSALGC